MKEETIEQEGGGDHIQTSTADLPTLELSRKVSTRDFVTQEVSIKCKGWSISEAAEGFKYLVGFLPAEVTKKK